MSLLKSRLAVVGIASVVLTGALFATENSYAKAKKAPSITYKNLSYKDFTLNFAALKDIAPLAKKGKGNVDVILPDTTSSTRYTEFDAPYLDEAFKDAGLKSGQYKVQNADGSDSTFITDAEADVSSGAKVLLIDPEDSGTGETVESYAAAHNVKVIDYDRLTLGGSRAYYVSFNNTFVGTLLGLVAEPRDVQEIERVVGGAARRRSNGRRRRLPDAGGAPRRRSRRPPSGWRACLLYVHRLRR